LYLKIFSLIRNGWYLFTTENCSLNICLTILKFLFSDVRCSHFFICFKTVLVLSVRDCLFYIFYLYKRFILEVLVIYFPQCISISMQFHGQVGKQFRLSPRYCHLPSVGSPSRSLARGNDFYTSQHMAISYL